MRDARQPKEKSDWNYNNTKRCPVLFLRKNIGVQLKRSSQKKNLKTHKSKTSFPLSSFKAHKHTFIQAMTIKQTTPPFNRHKRVRIRRRQLFKFELPAASDWFSFLFTGSKWCTIKDRQNHRRRQKHQKRQREADWEAKCSCLFSQIAEANRSYVNSDCIAGVCTHLSREKRGKSYDEREKRRKNGKMADWRWANINLPACLLGAQCMYYVRAD